MIYARQLAWPESATKRDGRERRCIRRRLLVVLEGSRIGMRVREIHLFYFSKRK